jgi:RNA polymerase sigma factor (sigma-70 family)
MWSEVPTVLANLLTAERQGGEERAWSDFLRVYSPVVLQGSKPFGREYDDTMDRYLFVVEHLRRDGYSRLRRYQPRPGCEFRHWLLVVTRHLCLDFHRHRYGRARPSSRTDRAMRSRLAKLIPVHDAITKLTAAEATQPDVMLHVAERVRLLREAVRELDPHDRLLLKLRFEDELPAQEMARFLGLPSEFHVYRRLRRVIGTLRVTLRSRGVEVGDI